MGKLQDEGINVNLHIPNSHPPSFSTRLNAVDVPAAAAGKNDRSVHLLFQLRQRWRYFLIFFTAFPLISPPPIFFLAPPSFSHPKEATRRCASYPRVQRTQDLSTERDRMIEC